MVPATLATDMDGYGGFKLVSTPGSLNWKHGIGGVSHGGLRRTRVDQCVHPQCMCREQVASDSYTYHPQTCPAWAREILPWSALRTSSLQPPHDACTL